MKRNAVLSLMLFVALASIAFAQQQDKSKRPSPPATATHSFEDGKKITVNYSQPSMKGRKIYGGLVPFGEVWRTGANEATTLTTDTNLNIGGTDVPAGTYTLFTIPDQNGWKLIINRQTGQWGTDYKEAQDLARVDMKASKLNQPMEKFTISFEKAGQGAATMNLDWENTRASVDVKEAK